MLELPGAVACTVIRPVEVAVSISPPEGFVERDPGPEITE
jgi:hypothetical protein